MQGTNEYHFFDPPKLGTPPKLEALTVFPKRDTAATSTKMDHDAIDLRPLFNAQATKILFPNSILLQEMKTLNETHFLDTPVSQRAWAFPP